MIDYNLFEDILGFDSTSGRERPLAEFLSRRLKAPKVETFEVGDGTLNLLLSWGVPRSCSAPTWTPCRPTSLRT